MLDSTPLTLSPGTDLPIGVTVRHFVGAGPTGEVYAADRQGHMVAVKLLSPTLASDSTALDRLIRLQTHLRKVHHPGVARALGMGEHQGYRLLVREFVPGRSASDLVLHAGPLPPTRAISVALRAAEALTEAHRSGALHLNLKPSNLFVLEGDQVKLVDFGVAQRLELERGALYGDPHYLAPEQYDGKLVSFRSDIYGLGSLLYFLLTGQAPYHGDPSVYTGPMGIEPPPPSSLVPGLSGKVKLDQLVLRAVQQAPNKRYLSVQHFGRVMDGMLEELHTSHGTIPSRRPAQTLRMGEVMPPEAYHPQPPPAGYGPARLGARVDEDTVRMVVPHPRFEPAAGDSIPLRGGKATMPLPYAVSHDTIREPVRVPGGYHPGPAPALPGGRDEHDTIRVVVPPPAGRQVSPAPAYPQQPYPAPGAGAEAGDDILIVAEEPVTEPLKRRRKKRKKPRDPVIAVRGEAAFRLEVGRIVEDGPQGHSVLVQSDLFDEARGPQRNLETMEIRISPGIRAENPESRSLGKAGQILIAVGALLLLFVLAALGAAALAHWLSAPDRGEPEDRIELPQGTGDLPSPQ